MFVFGVFGYAIGVGTRPFGLRAGLDLLGEVLGFHGAGVGDVGDKFSGGNRICPGYLSDFVECFIIQARLLSAASSANVLP